MYNILIYKRVLTPIIYPLFIFQPLLRNYILLFIHPNKLHFAIQPIHFWCFINIQPQNPSLHDYVNRIQSKCLKLTANTCTIIWK